MLLGLSLIFSLNLFAIQIKNLKDNQTATCVVARENKTRIFVENDRIIALHGTPGAYLYVNDEVNGEVFITPTPEYQNKNFSLFVSTENHHTFGLKLIPQNKLTETIMLKNLEVDKVKADKWENSGTYQAVIINLLRHMANQQVPDGYIICHPENSPKFKFRNFKIQLQAIYEGVHLNGKIYCLTNINSCPIQIIESQFYKPGVLAVTLQKYHLNPAESSLIYLVRQNV